MNNLKLNILLLTLLSLTSSYLEAQTLDWVIPNQSCTQGDTILVPVQLTTNPTGLDILAFQASVRYWSFGGQLIGIETAGTLAEELGAVFHETEVVSNYSYLRVSAAGSAPLMQSGVLFYARMVVFSSGTLEFHGSNLVNEGSPSLNMQDAWISASAPPTITVSPNTVEMLIGETQQFTVARATDPLSWSTTDTVLANISSAGVLTAQQQGSVQVRVEDSLGLVDFTSTIEIRSVELEVEDVSTVAGDTVILPIVLHNPSQTPISAGQMGLTYSSSRLEFIEVVTAGTQLASASVQHAVDASSSTRRLDIGYAVGQPLVSDLPIVFVRMRVLPQSFSSVADVTVASALFNESLNVRGNDGRVSYSRTPSLSVTPSGAQDVAVGELLDFDVSGGTPPYRWEVTNPDIGVLRIDGRFMARSPGQGYVEVYDQTGLVGRSGLITVVDGEIYFPTICAAPSDTVWLPLVVTPLENDEITSFQIDLEYRDPELSYVGIDQANSASESWFVIDQVISSDEVQIVAAGANATRGGEALIYIGFATTASLTNNELAPVELTNYLINEGAPNLKHITGGVRRRTEQITSITATQVTDCDLNGTHDVDLTISYIHPPASGTLEVNGQSFAITGSPQQVTLVNVLQTTGDVFAKFSSAACGHYYEDVYVAPVCVSNIIYVDPKSRGRADGTSWHHAYLSLTDALAEANTSPDREIWVASETYTVDTLSSSEDNFMVPDATTLRGHFEGFESRASARSMDVRLGTFLSGHIPGGGQLYHVISRPSGGAMSYISDVTISDGAAVGIGDASRGGGLLNQGALTLTNVHFISNIASEDGGGIYTIADPSSHLTLESVTISSHLPSAGGPFSSELGARVDMQNVDIQP